MVAVNNCQMCQDNPEAQKQFADNGLADGEICPVCYNPTCRNHLRTVRWRWRKTGELDSTLVCQDCLRSYKHRDWDRYNKDWIT